MLCYCAVMPSSATRFPNVDQLDKYIDEKLGKMRNDRNATMQSSGDDEVLTNSDVFKPYVEVISGATTVNRKESQEGDSGAFREKVKASLLQDLTVHISSHYVASTTPKMSPTLISPNTSCVEIWQSPMSCFLVTVAP